MSHWRAVQHDTGRTLDTGGAEEPGSFALASDMVDLAWKFMGQGDTVTLELVDESGAVLERRAPHPKPMPIDPDRLTGILTRFGLVFLLLVTAAACDEGVRPAAEKSDAVWLTIEHEAMVSGTRLVVACNASTGDRVYILGPGSDGKAIAVIPGACK